MITFATAHSERVYLPELIRMRGELREHGDARAQDYREARDLARTSGAKSLEQRAADSLAALSNA
jgi:hypothetical protein